MRFLFEALQWRLVVDLSPTVVADDDDDEEESHARTGADLAFGFTSDPAFPEFEYEEEEE